MSTLHFSSDIGLAPGPLAGPWKNCEVDIFFAAISKTGQFIGRGGHSRKCPFPGLMLVESLGFCFCSNVQAGLPKKRFLFGHLFLNTTNVFCAKKQVGHACICPRRVTAG